MVNNETVKYLVTNFDVSQLFAAFLCHEVPFRLEEVHDVAPDKVKHIKNEIIKDLYNNSDSMFNYDAIDTIIDFYLKMKGYIS